MIDWFDEFAQAQRARILAHLDQTLAKVQAARDEAFRQQLCVEGVRFPGDHAELVMTARTHASGVSVVPSHDHSDDE